MCFSITIRERPSRCAAHKAKRFSQSRSSRSASVVVAESEQINSTIAHLARCCAYLLDVDTSNFRCDVSKIVERTIFKKSLFRFLTFSGTLQQHTKLRVRRHEELWSSCTATSFAWAVESRSSESLNPLPVAFVPGVGASLPTRIEVIVSRSRRVFGSAVQNRGSSSLWQRSCVADDPLGVSVVHSGETVAFCLLMFWNLDLLKSAA